MCVRASERARACECERCDCSSAIPPQTGFTPEEVALRSTHEVTLGVVVHASRCKSSHFPSCLFARFLRSRDRREAEKERTREKERERTRERAKERARESSPSPAAAAAAAASAAAAAAAAPPSTSHREQGASPGTSTRKDAAAGR